MTKGGSKMARTLCRACRKDVAYSVPKGGDRAYLMPHNDPRTGQSCEQSVQPLGGIPLIEVLDEAHETAD